jgi:twinfilin-like protein
LSVLIQGNEWILLFYVPDIVKVKEKMVYAASLSTLKNTLGSYYFVHEIRGSVPDDVNRTGYKASCKQALTFAGP